MHHADDMFWGEQGRVGDVHTDTTLKSQRPDGDSCPVPPVFLRRLLKLW